MKDIRGMDKAEEEEDRVEVVDRSFSIILGHQGTIPIMSILCSV